MEDKQLKAIASKLQEQRLDSGMSMLSQSELLKMARIYVHQKGINQNPVIVWKGETLYLKGGAYSSMETIKESKIINDWKGTDKFPWNPLDKREFWCQHLGSKVKMTGRLDNNGTYYVMRAESEDNRHHPVRGCEIVLDKDKAEVGANADVLEINKSSYLQIKNFMCDRFIKIYPWESIEDKTPDIVRQEMEAKARARKGYAKQVEEERDTRGHFDNAESFKMRMNEISSSFPWDDFAILLDFSLPNL